MPPHPHMHTHLAPTCTPTWPSPASPHAPVCPDLHTPFTGGPRWCLGCMGSTLHTLSPPSSRRTEMAVLRVQRAARMWLLSMRFPAGELAVLRVGDRWAEGCQTSHSLACTTSQPRPTLLFSQADPAQQSHSITPRKSPSPKSPTPKSPSPKSPSLKSTSPKSVSPKSFSPPHRCAGDGAARRGRAQPRPLCHLRPFRPLHRAGRMW